MLDHFSAKNLIEVRRQMPTKQSLRRWNAEQRGEQLRGESVLVDDEATVDAGTAHVRRVLRKIDDAQPFHYAMIRPEGHVGTVGAISVHRSPLQIVELKIQIP